MRATIKFNGERFSIDIDEGAKVRDLKRKIAEVRGCRPSEIRLILNGQVLVKSQRLSTYNIDPDKVILMLIDSDSDQPKSSETPGDEYGSRPVRPPPDFPPGYTGFSSSGPGRPTAQELDRDFYLAISKSPLKERLNKPFVHAILNRIYTSLSDISGGAFCGAIERLKLIPALNLDEELGRMAEMEIGNRDLNLEALKKCNGDVDEAVTWLIDNAKI
jgi:hypothetical protein